MHYDAVQQCLFSEWTGRHDQASVRKYCEQILSCLYAHPVGKILSDHSQLQGEWHEAASWVGTRMFSRFAALGVGHVAWVAAQQNQADRSAMEAALRAADYPVVSIFDDVDSAYSWLLQAPQQLTRPFLA
ncbi:hypothetical protein B0919_08405 [Hymenobacter sp. CRA2]|nr:hypothetical protein B0919_08405 [Hymenobacter sp. CRA2]